ncbi:uncharacterized protein LOC119329478 [Triticum dicoccoides]|uniref:uncharacterized protein LOC119329478 n=1 Tax=Triticum dicoccoides TaxID=85692 RepID=UPI0018917C46|nr:uncharacterized protein LOC119329478 [Triticum dicoccoides]
MEQVDIWAPILADPITSQQAEIKVHSAYVDYGTMDFQALLEGPHDLDGWLKCAFVPNYIKEANLTHEIECNIYSPTSDHGMTIQTPMPAPPEALPEKEQALHHDSQRGRRRRGGDERGRRGHVPAALSPTKQEACGHRHTAGGGDLRSTRLRTEKWLEAWKSCEKCTGERNMVDKHGTMPKTWAQKKQ